MQPNNQPITRFAKTKETPFRVERTEDLGIFNRFDANRDVMDGHMKMLARAMTKKVLYAPLYVNEDMKIVDGQHRHEALTKRSLWDNKPYGTEYIKFTGEGYDASVIPIYNTNAINWKTKDYVHAYLEQEGKQEYVLLDSFLAYTAQKLASANIPSKIAFSTGLAMILLVGKDDLSKLKNGTMRIGNANYNRALKTFDALIDFKNANVKVWKQKKFIQAFASFCANNYDHRKMLKELSKGKAAGHFVPQKRVENYRDIIVEFYNGLA